MNAKWHIINHLACAVVFLSVCSFSAFSQERDTIFIIEHDTVWMDLQPDAVIESQTRENRYDRRVHQADIHRQAELPSLEPANKTEPFFCRTAGLRYVSEHGIRR